jgi:hypothetical protein
VIVPRLTLLTDLLCVFGKACFVAAGLEGFCGPAIAIPAKAPSTIPVVAVRIDFLIFISLSPWFDANRVAFRRIKRFGN